MNDRTRVKYKMENCKKQKQKRVHHCNVNYK